MSSLNYLEEYHEKTAQNPSVSMEALLRAKQKATTGEEMTSSFGGILFRQPSGATSWSAC
jgi:hypothetical protein